MQALRPDGKALTERLLQDRPGLIHRLLTPFITQSRLQRMEEVLSMRSRRVAVVLDDIYHQHNMSAVVRSMDAFGFLDLHVLELENRFRTSHGVALGSEQWIEIHRHDDMDQCIQGLKKEGRMILAADPPAALGRYPAGAPCFELEELPIGDHSLALVFGRERDGLHDRLRQLCDGAFFIPLCGFVESLNVSVSVAIALSRLRSELNRMPTAEWGLGEADKIRLRDLYCLRSVRNGPAVLVELIARSDTLRHLL